MLEAGGLKAFTVAVGEELGRSQYKSAGSDSIGTPCIVGDHGSTAYVFAF